MRPVILSFSSNDKAEQEVYDFAREYTRRLNVPSDEIKANFKKYLQPLNEKADIIAQKYGRYPNEYRKGSFCLYEIVHKVLDAHVFVKGAMEWQDWEKGRIVQI
jgi:hypothetical protein